MKNQSSADFSWRKILVVIFATSFLMNGASRADAPNVESDGNQPHGDLQRHLDEGDYGDAVRLADAIVEDLDGSSGSQSYRHAVAIHNLAVLQQLTEHPIQAEQNFQRAISLIAATEGGYSPLMVPSLNEFAILSYKTGRLDESLELLRRSQHIIQRSHGVYSLEQSETLNWISKVLLASRESLQADVQERFHYKIHEKNFGRSDPRIVPALSRLGDWLRNSGQYREALKVHRRAVSIIEQNSTPDLQVLPFLRDISATLYLLGVCCPAKPLQRAVDIVVSHPDSDPGDEVNAMIYLADMHLVQARNRKAKKLYKQAWQSSAAGRIDGGPARFGSSDPSPLGLVGVDAAAVAYRRAKLSGAPGGRTTKITQVRSTRKQQRGPSMASSAGSSERILIGSPLRLCYSHVVDLVPKTVRREISGYYVDLDYSVNSNGTVLAVEVADSNTPARLTAYVKNLLRSVRYRPRMTNGETLATNHLMLKQTFTAAGSGNTHGNLEFGTAATIRGCKMVAGIN
ncbi:MAG: tetratricopeptide repeat protein [Pseudomonadales bacterium]|jgi:tetratricopeptide (TPR) repeat protein|nr:tetratricopeptide repeat protein [Pseudomonadales bacterium]HJN52246.1 tetratricopeptide repeat protein [Pseudomonadales bacterium]